TDVQAAIREHAIHIKDAGAHVTGWLQDGLREPQGGGQRPHQITLARIRSLVFNAPTSAPCASTTSTVVMRCASIKATASAASRSSPIVRGPGVITSSAVS